MLIWSKIFVFELRPMKFGRLVAMPKGFPKLPEKGGQSLPISGKSAQISNFDPQYLLSQEVLGSNFGMRR